MEKIKLRLDLTGKTKSPKNVSYPVEEHAILRVPEEWSGELAELVQSKPNAIPLILRWKGTPCRDGHSRL